MVVSGVLSPSEAYDAVNWNVVFLLAGVVPLGIALRETGAVALVADSLVGNDAHVPAGDAELEHFWGKAA